MIKFQENTAPQLNVEKLQVQYIDFLKSSPAFIANIKNKKWVESLKKRVQSISPFKQVCVLGVGGSSLGLKAIYSALKFKSEVLFFESLDSFSILEKTKKIDYKNAHFVVISKSGNTIETMEQLKWFDVILKENTFNFSNQMTIITENKKNPLWNYAQENKVPTLEIPLDLGGRFSVLSPVGMFVAELGGLDTNLFLEGAEYSLENNQLVMQTADQLLQSLKDERWITNMWIYSERLFLLGSWFEQLWAESLAKSKTLDGTAAPRISTPNTLLGSHDQHSLLQQIMEGHRDKFIIFIRSQEEETLIPELGKVLKAQVQSVQKSLKEVNVHSFQLFFNKVSEKEVGGFFMLWQLVVGFIGHLYRINTYDQPGVERAKVLTKEILKRS